LKSLATCRSAIGFILRISHGYTVKGHDDPFIHYAELLDQDVRTIYSFGWIVDYIPARQHSLPLFLAFGKLTPVEIVQLLPEGFPGTGFKKVARGASQRLHNFVNAPYRFTKEQLVSSCSDVTM
jgi:hypothetical protein